MIIRNNTQMNVKSLLTLQLIYNINKNKYQQNYQFSFNSRMIKTTSEDQFHSYYLKLQKDPHLVAHVRWKLEFIASKILNSEMKVMSQELAQECRMEIQQLKHLDRNTLIIIFNSIFKALYTDKIVMERKCQFKKKGFFEFYKDAYIQYNDQTITITLDKTKKVYKLTDVKISSNKKKVISVVCRKDTAFFLKFQKAQTFEMYLQKLQELCQKCKQKRLKEKASFRSLKSEPFLDSYSKEEKIEPISISDQDENQIQRDIEQIKKNKKMMKQLDQPQQMNMKKKKIKSEAFLGMSSSLNQSKSSSSDQSPLQNTKSKRNAYYSLSSMQPNYEIVSESQKYCLSKHTMESKIRIEVLTKIQDPLSLVINVLINQKGWNSTVLSEEIYLLPDQENTLEIYRTFKKKSFWFGERETLTRLTFQHQIHNENTELFVENATLTELNYENLKRPEVLVRSTINTKFQLFSSEKGLKIIVDSDYNAAGYCDVRQSQQSLLKMFEDLIYFEDYYKICKIKKEVFSGFVIPEENQDENQLQYEKNQNLDLKEFENEEKSQEFYSILDSYEKAMKLEDLQNMNIENVKTAETMFVPGVRPLSFRKSAQKIEKMLLINLHPNKPTQIPSGDYIQLILNNEHEKSYLGLKFQQKCLEKFDVYPPPYCLQELLKKGGQYQVSQAKELVFINHAQIQGQKDTLKYVIRQIGSNIISGKSIMNVSLPVDIFQARSLLERSAASFGCIPDSLCPVAEAEPLTQMKSIFTFLASIPTLQLIMQKPFNPILGQTFQGYLKGIPISYEQISHHPPISAYYMKCQEFTLYGNLIAFADVSINSAVGGNIGAMHIIFANGTHFECYFPPGQISGLIYGQRKYRSYGKGFAIQKNHRLFTEFSIQEHKKGLYQKKQKEKLTPGDIIGGIFKVTPEFVQKMSKIESIRKFSGLQKKHVQQKLSEIRGVWFEDIYIDGQIVNRDIKIYPVQYQKICLPSDSNFRLDVLYLKEGNMTESQKYKDVFENIQRADKKMRERYQRNIKKNP